jgi:hypothetical protein
VKPAVANAMIKLWAVRLRRRPVGSPTPSSHGNCSSRTRRCATTSRTSSASPTPSPPRCAPRRTGRRPAPSTRRRSMELVLNQFYPGPGERPGPQLARSRRPPLPAAGAGCAVPSVPVRAECTDARPCLIRLYALHRGEQVSARFAAGRCRRVAQSASSSPDGEVAHLSPPTRWRCSSGWRGHRSRRPSPSRSRPQTAEPRRETALPAKRPRPWPAVTSGAVRAGRRCEGHPPNWTSADACDTPEPS